MTVTHDEQMEAYGQAVKSGLYAKKSGLVGKYDNVRLYWEDELTRNYIHPHLRKLIERSKSLMRRVRIMDLGCGSADGYELLTGIRRRDPDLRTVDIGLLNDNVLGLYKGVDLSEELLGQAMNIYGGNPKMAFEQADFAQGLPVGDDERPYDLYFTSYGTCSHHNDDETFINMLAQIARRVEEYCVVVCDWLGRYSYEWQSLWTNDLSQNRNMDYVVSYIYDRDEREARRDELQHLYLRLVSRREAEGMIAEAMKRSGVEITPLKYFDRSGLTGRHMDTGDYNRHARPLREAVNSLHEANLRTNLDTVMFNYVPKKGFDFLNDYFENLQMCWNTLVEYTECLLDHYDGSAQGFSVRPPDVPASYPPVLVEMMNRMRRVVEGVGWLGMGLSRENIIEPQLGYALRYLVNNLQQGMGCAHGLVCILEIDKRSK